MKLLHMLYAAALGAFAVQPAFAGAYPERPIRLIVPVPPGGANDLVARLVGDAITAQTGQSVIIDNRGGAGGMIGMSAVARADPDGYTLLLGSSGQITTTRLLYEHPMLDPVKDLEPVAPVADIQLIAAVNKDVPVKTFAQFVAYVKAHPGQLNYTSAGPGSGTHLAGDQLLRQAGIMLAHIPYKGANPALTDVLAGRVQMITLGANSLIPHIRSGKLRPLVVASNKRLSYLPEVPTAAEAGVPNWNLTVWFGLFGPRGMPADVMEKLNGLVRKLADNAAARQQMDAAYMAPMDMSPKQFADFVDDDVVKWERIVKDAGIPPQ